MILNRITSGEVPPLVDEMVSHHHMRIRTAPPGRREIISAINALKRSKVAGLDDLPAKLFIAVHAVITDLLLPERSQRREPAFNVNWRDIYVLPAVAKIIAKITL